MRSYRRGEWTVYESIREGLIFANEPFVNEGTHCDDQSDFLRGPGDNSQYPGSVIATDECRRLEGYATGLVQAVRSVPFSFNGQVNTAFMETLYKPEQQFDMVHYQYTVNSGYGGKLRSDGPGCPAVYMNDNKLGNLVPTDSNWHRVAIRRTGSATSTDWMHEGRPLETNTHRSNTGVLEYEVRQRCLYTSGMEHGRFYIWERPLSESEMRWLTTLPRGQSIFQTPPMWLPSSSVTPPTITIGGDLKQSKQTISGTLNVVPPGAETVSGDLRQTPQTISGTLTRTPAVGLNSLLSQSPQVISGAMTIGRQADGDLKPSRQLISGTISVSSPGVADLNGSLVQSPQIISGTLDRVGLPKNALGYLRQTEQRITGFLATADFQQPITGNVYTINDLHVYTLQDKQVYT